ncbi:MAG: diacylglycerol/lipid kinase family protein [Deltaproteobacteria bacterium]
MNGSVAVLLNANAKQVTGRVRGAISHVMPPEDIFLSKSQRDARSIARAVLDRSYGTVFIGGGDGTFVGFLNEIYDCLDRPVPVETGRGFQAPARSVAPKFGMLKLGTGNAVASLVGASPLRGGGILDDLLRARSGEFPGVYQLDLLEAEGRRCPFAGFGIDAAIINDYAALKQRFHGGTLGRIASGGSGYAASITGKTLPHYLRGGGKAEVEVVNAGGRAVRVGRGGRELGTFAPGEVLYRGPVNVLAGSTVPNFGFNFKFFPFAGKERGKMHLRVSRVPVLTVVRNLPEVWRGSYSNEEDCFDFLCDKVCVRFDRPMPFQIGGDAEGYREKVCFGIADRTVDMVSFNQQLLH